MRISQKLVLKLIRTKFTLLGLLSKKKAAQQAFRLFCTPQHRNTKAPPRIFNEAEQLQFTWRHYKIQGYRWNGGASRKAMILHGFESSAVNFDRYVRPLLRKGYEVLAFDAPAHGRSTGRQINVRIYKEFILHLVQQFGPVQSYIGHSLGGLAITLALEEIDHDRDTKVALIAPATETTTAIKSYFNFIGLDQNIKGEFEKLIIKIGGQPSSWYSVSRAVPNLKANILWAHDKGDTMTPFSDVEPVMEQHYPNILFRITEGLGHRRIYRDNNTFKAIIDFL
jgi:pimeloyl-ACP methyl ester carboxylesterase